MLVIGLNGSPNKDGNTRYLLDRLLAKAKSLGVETALLNVDEIITAAGNSFCTACSTPCSAACYEGTELEKAFHLIRKADGIVFGSPVYFGTVSGQLKAMFDKSRALRTEKALYNKVGAGLTCGAAKFGGQETTIKALHDIMLVHGMLIVGDGYLDDDCGHHGVCSVSPVENDRYALKRSEILAKRMVEVCRATMSLRDIK